jgi:hypothetical protein
MDYDIQRCTRHCAATGRELAEGEWFFSVLVRTEGAVTRLDYALEAWNGPPAEAIACWKSRMPTREHRRARMAPSEVLLHLFEELGNKPDQADLHYVLALLLVRRRIARLEDSDEPTGSPETMVLYCPRNEQTYRVPVRWIAADRQTVLQQELSRMLFAESTTSSDEAPESSTGGDSSTAGPGERSKA